MDLRSLPSLRDLLGSRRHAPEGEAPGTVSVDPEAIAPVMQVIAYDAQGFIERPLEALDELDALQARWPVVWLNVIGLADPALIERIGKRFGFHPLAMEDVVHLHQRAKVEPYQDHLYIVMRMHNDEAERMSEQISMFMGARFALTFQEVPGDCLEPLRVRIRQSRGKVRQKGADYLSYAIIDAIVDGYFKPLDDYGAQLDDLEDNLLELSGSHVIEQIHAIRRELMAMRRAVRPMRDAVQQLMHDTSGLITDETRLYLRDCVDHAVQLVELVENYREMTASLMELYLSFTNSRMNDVIKTLTIISTIFIPLSFVAGVYGMNFDTASPYNMPELRMTMGYPMVIGLMVTMVAVMLVYFRRKGWL